MVIFLKYASETEEDQYCHPCCHSLIHHPLQLVFSHHSGAQANLVSNEAFAVQSFCALMKLSQTTFLGDFCVVQSLNHQRGDCWIALADHVECVRPRTPVRSGIGNPSPPMRMVRDANCFASRRSSAAPGVTPSVAAYSLESSGGKVRITWLARGLAL